MNRIAVLIFASCLMVLPFPIETLEAAETVTITQKATGKSVEAIIEGVEKGVVRFSLPGGPPFELPASQLTEDSIERIKVHLAAGSAPDPELLQTFTKLNTLIGHDLFAQSPSVWEENAGEVAERLALRRESLKETSSSYRLYTPQDFQFLGAHPYCITLYGGAGEKPERFSLVFANKGDFGSRLGMGEDHFREIYTDREPPGDLDAAIDLDAEVISEHLTEGLGEPVEQFYGEREDRRKVQRWDVGDHAFLLSSLEDEYTSLVIVPTPNADVEGKVDFVADSDFKKIQIENVRYEDNGDVWIDNIPMVDQGPKGYCAPATFERAMRYMLVPADMYLLATAATAPGGGTNTTKLADDCKRIVSSKARRIRDLDLKDKFEIDTVKDYIDKGVPVLWQMRSLGPYNQIANERTEARADVTDFASWAAEIQSEAQSTAPSLQNVEDNHHICMIIGYNESTQEIAVSDSWGPRYELRWVHIDLVRAVTNRGGFVIDF